MFSKIGTGELIIILIIALFVIGPNKLPGVAKSVGKAVGSARKYLKDITEDVKSEMDEIKADISVVEKDIRETQKLIQADMKEIVQDVQPKELNASQEEVAEGAGVAAAEAEDTEAAAKEEKEATVEAV